MVSLAGKRIALPETRELDLLVRMLESRGASAVRCPLISILDTPDAGPVEQWLRRFTSGHCDDLILTTGEGVRRLLAFADRLGARNDFVGALARVRKITRGPKPVRALREMGLDTDLPSVTPTTDGIIATLGQHDLVGRVVGIQLYGDDPNRNLTAFLAEAGARCDPVAPYVYASEADEARVGALISQLAAGGVDAIAFTSSLQIRRLWDVATKLGLETELQHGLERTIIAAVGPLVAAEVERHGLRPQAVPERVYSLKPMIAALEQALPEVSGH